MRNVIVVVLCVLVYNIFVISFKDEVDCEAGGNVAVAISEKKTVVTVVVVVVVVFGVNGVGCGGCSSGGGDGGDDDTEIVTIATVIILSFFHKSVLKPSDARGMNSFRETRESD